jgi:hypothetical protein
MSNKTDIPEKVYCSWCPEDIILLDGKEDGTFEEYTFLSYNLDEATEYMGVKKWEETGAKVFEYTLSDKVSQLSIADLPTASEAKKAIENNISNPTIEFLSYWRSVVATEIKRAIDNCETYSLVYLPNMDVVKKDIETSLSAKGYTVSVCEAFTSDKVEMRIFWK